MPQYRGLNALDLPLFIPTKMPFLKYKRMRQQMVNSLKLVDINALDLDAALIAECSGNAKRNQNAEGELYTQKIFFYFLYQQF